MSIFHKFIESLDGWFKKSKESTEISNVVKEGVPYHEIRESLNSLDLVCFRGGDGVADLITYLEKIQGAKTSRYKLWGKKKIKVPANAFSHLGIIVKSDILDDPRLDPDTPYVFESTMSGSLTDGVYNIEGEAFLGVQLRNFDDVMRGYDSAIDSKIAIARLDRNLLDGFSNEEIKTSFTEIFHRYNHIPYDFNPVSLLSSIFKLPRCLRRAAETAASSRDWLFCSELVAVVYQDMGLIPDDVNPRDVVPMDFLGYDADTNGVPCIVEPPEYITIHPKNDNIIINDI